MIVDEIRERLLSLADKDYKAFQSPLIPTVDGARFIGVRTPVLRAAAKELSKREDVGVFLADLPHGFFEEDQLHAFLISEIKSFGVCVREIDRFLPYVNNWATTDQMTPKVFKKHKAELIVKIRQWIKSEHPFTVRFAIKMLMDHYLEESFDSAFLSWVAAAASSDYYVNMMAAWYFATALAKRWDDVLPYYTEKKLDDFVFQKAIRKALESFRITEEHKAFLRGLTKQKKGEKDDRV